jgi:hypothetical protein
MPRWLGSAEHVIHLDIHTGLGRRGDLTLLLEDTVTPDRVRWLSGRFGEDRVEWSGEGIAYPTRGGLGTWCQATFADRSYDYLCAEFGTDPGPVVLAALRAENRAHHWGRPDAPSTARARRRLLEAFAPSDVRWRSTTLSRGLRLVRKAIEVCSPSAALSRHD